MSATEPLSEYSRVESDIRRYWQADRPFDALADGFDRLSALVMLAEIDRLAAGREETTP